jgi:hypothetical protein
VTILWCASEVDLHSVVFAGASVLDQGLGSSGPPVLKRVDALDGESLRLANVDVSSTRLSEAISLGPLDVGRLPFGTGGAGLTRRHYLADEEESPRPSAGVLARTYRDLRTSAETVGNFSDANDLHYGERLWQRKSSRLGSVAWLWLAAYGLVGYGVRPWRPLALLVSLVVATALAFSWSDGLEKTRTVDGSKKETNAVLCRKDRAPRSPERRQVVSCDATTGESLEFAIRSSTSLIRPATGYELRGSGAVVEVGSRLLTALLFGLFVLAMRNRLKR